MHIRKECFVNSRDKEMFLFIHVASGPLHYYSLHIYPALCNNASLLWSLPQSASGQLEISAVCVKTNRKFRTFYRFGQKTFLWPFIYGNKI